MLRPGCAGGWPPDEQLAPDKQPGRRRRADDGGPLAGTVLPPRPQRQDSPAARAAGLIAVAEDLAGEFSLRPLLERILRRCTELLGCDAGLDLQRRRGGRHVPQGSRHRRGLPVRPGLPAHRGHDRRRGGPPRRRSGSPATTRCPAGTWRRRTGPPCAGSSACRWSGAAGSSAPASCSAGTSGASSARTTPSCCSCSPSTPRSRWPTPGCTRRPRSGPGPRRPRPSGTGCSASCTTRSPSGWSASGRTWTACSGTGGRRRPSRRTGRRTGRRAGRAPRAGRRGDQGGPGRGPADAARTCRRRPTAWTWRPRSSPRRPGPRRIGRLEVRLVSAGTPVEVEGRVARELILLAREALTNIVRHARPRLSVRLGLLYEQAAVSLLVQDDGQGFDTDVGLARARVSGCALMTERAREWARQSTSTRCLAGAPGSAPVFPCGLPARDDQAGPPLRVLVAARRPVLRAGLARLLTWTEPGVEVVGEVETAAEAAGRPAADAAAGRGAGRPRPARRPRRPAAPRRGHRPAAGRRAPAGRGRAVRGRRRRAGRRGDAGRGARLRGPRRDRPAARAGRGRGGPGPGHPVRRGARPAAPRAAHRGPRPSGSARSAS